jgi:hypothetical protein
MTIKRYAPGSTAVKSGSEKEAAESRQIEQRTDWVERRAQNANAAVDLSTGGTSPILQLFQFKEAEFRH